MLVINTHELDTVMTTKHHAAIPPMVSPSWNTTRYQRPTSISALAARGLRLVFNSLVQLQDRARQRDALANLDKRLLLDIGLTHADVTRATGQRR
jgi:uncharacterized protein YjiS (DUF1127 family)